jgi:hypothetical protein
MKLKIYLSVIILFITSSAFGQRLKDGIYLFSIRDAEYIEHPIVAKCKVIIQGIKIKVIYTDSSLTLIKYGHVLDDGILLWHRKTKQWIIGHSKKDVHAKEVGGCSDGPRVIDLKKREIWNC